MKYRWCTAQARYFLGEGSWMQSEQLAQRHRRLKKKKSRILKRIFFFIEHRLKRILQKMVPVRDHYPLPRMRPASIL